MPVQVDMGVSARLALGGGGGGGGGSSTKM